MKILVVGDGHSDIHEVAVVTAFNQLGHVVDSFFWLDYFKSTNFLVHLCLRLQNKFLIGPVIAKLNRGFVSKSLEFKPDLIFVYRGTHIKSSSIIAIKNALPACRILGYNNDDPYSHGHSLWLWKHFMKCVPLYDVMFAYRQHNVAEYLESGAKKVELLMPWFVPSKDKPKLPCEAIERKFDVVFIGHFEDDQRVQYLRKISESNFKLGLFGPDWNRAPSFDWLTKYQPVLPLRGDLYRTTLLSSDIALCFLSALNRDTYTRRCFEIPAMGVFMLCQYSSDLAQLFEDGVDAVFFHNPEDMMEKIQYYLHHGDERNQIAANGQSRVVRDKHDIVSRMNYVLQNIS